MFVSVAVSVGVFVSVGVLVSVAVASGVLVLVSVAVPVGVLVLVSVAVSVAVLVGVAVGTSTPVISWLLVLSLGFRSVPFAPSSAIVAVLEMMSPFARGGVLTTVMANTTLPPEPAFKGPTG